MINWDVFTPGTATLGGLLIGISASMMLLCYGRVAGISGIAGGLFTPSDRLKERLLFLGGLLIGGAIMFAVFPQSFEITTNRGVAITAAAGLLVGFGTRYGSGCTSGHGVCGLSRGSIRSLTATMVFMAVGFGTATLLGQVLGAA